MALIESGPDNVVVIKVIGVGGAGNNAVNRMIEAGTTGVEFIAVNTDKPALSRSRADIMLQIGGKLTKGQGAGADPEVGKKAADESRQEIAKALDGAHMAFIACGMGGGTGTGASPVIADIAHEAGILTIGVVTKPFGFEGARRMKQAEVGVDSLLGKVDALFVIPNERLKLVSDQKISFKNAFEIADDVLRKSVMGISELVSHTDVVNLDFADVTTIMRNSGYAHMGVGFASGKDKGEHAARHAIASELMETSIDGARGIIVHVMGSEDLSLDDIDIAGEIVRSAAHPDANIIFGAGYDESMDDEIRVTVIATRFEERPRLASELAAVEEKPADKPAIDRSRPFSDAPRFNAAAVKEAPPAPEPEPEPEPEEEDPLETIYKIFNTR
jgi:cell division protein FtsZ